jgi:hypothetical protein
LPRLVHRTKGREPTGLLNKSNKSKYFRELISREIFIKTGDGKEKKNEEEKNILQEKGKKLENYITFCGARCIAGVYLGIYHRL